MLALAVPIALGVGVVLGMQVGGSGNEDASTTTTESNPSYVEDNSTAQTTSTTTSTTIQPTTTAAYDGQLFVSIDGDDTNNGWTEEAPLRTPQAAIDRAEPGAMILVGPGTFAPLVIDQKTDLTLSATDPTDSPIFTAESYDSGPGIMISSSRNVTLISVDARTSLWGMLVQSSSGITIDSAEIFDLGQEGITVSMNSSGVTIRNSRIYDTGNREGGNDRFLFSTFGEAIYIGTGTGLMEDGSFDMTNNILIQNNELFDTTAEAVDIKHSAHSVTVTDNLIYDVDTATSGAVVVGIGDRVYDDPNVLIEGNVIFDISRTSEFRDGNAITLSAPATVRNNVIWGTQHAGILLDSNLTSANGGVVVVESNLITATGLEPVSNRSPGSVDVAISNNVVGIQATDVFGGDPAVTPEQAREIIADLRSGTLTAQ